MKILVTGFEPFNGSQINPSEQIVYRLSAPDGVKLIKEILSVEFESSSARLRELFREHQPDAVLSVGQAGGRAEISVERLATMSLEDMVTALQAALNTVAAII